MHKFSPDINVFASYTSISLPISLFEQNNQVIDFSGTLHETFNVL